MNTTSEFVLYDAANSPAGRRVRMTLLEKNQTAEIRWLNLGLMDQKQAWYLALNPNGVVPTLLHGERVVFESNVINEYLDAVLDGPSLVPDDAPSQAKMRMWMAFELEWAKPFREAIYETYGKQRVKDSGLDEATLRRKIAERTSNPVYQTLAVRNPSYPRKVDTLMHRYKMQLARCQNAQEENPIVHGRVSS